MRLFLYTNSLYMNDKQHGIQGMHVLGDMFVKYYDEQEPLPPGQPERFDMLMDWAQNHKTVIMYKGVNSGNLQVIYDELKDTPYPCVKFHEDEESLGGALTSVGIILPAYLYEAADAVRSGRTLEEVAIEVQRRFTITDSIVIYRLTQSSLV